MLGSSASLLCDGCSSAGPSVLVVYDAENPEDALSPNLPCLVLCSRCVDHFEKLSWLPVWPAAAKALSRMRRERAAEWARTVYGEGVVARVLDDGRDVRLEPVLHIREEGEGVPAWRLGILILFSASAGAVLYLAWQGLSSLLKS